MDVHSYVLDQDVPHWAKGVPLIQVVTPAPPDMNTFLDSPLLHSSLPSTTVDSSQLMRWLRISE